jgi:hypothetical protein
VAQVEIEEAFSMDEDDKVRRNLVVFSAAVCITSFLKLPVIQVAATALKSDGSWNPSPWRVWSAALVVLMYLLLRYRFSDKYQAAFSLMVSDVKSALMEMSKLRAVECFEAAQSGRSTRAFGFDLDPIRDQLQAKVTSKTGTPADKIQYSYRVDRQERFKGVLNLSLVGIRVLNTSEESPIAKSDARVEYELPSWMRARVLLAATVQSTIYSSRFVNHAIPVLLGWAALALSAWKLMHAV